MRAVVRRRPFTAKEYHRLLEAGILREDDRVELIEGEILEMSPIGSRHLAAVNRIARLFFQRFGDRAIVSVQNPIHLDPRSEPQPDLTLLKPNPSDYAEALPTPQEVLLLVEVMDTSQAYDREVKLPLYARAGIPEVWLLDLEARRLEVYRKPTPEGFAEARALGPEETVAPLSFPEARLPVAHLLVP
ncbi:Uma2 family endonuclease [Thermus sediminis]|uniref:Uma2 family endonuclease n=1 Tax=Thermus sediminis TaxID=1761908 RepID=UPI000E3E1C97|nr:Uma2 family endonuclease [Thermus sediminis]